MTIPASQVVSVNPNVLSAGGRALDIIAVLLTTSSRVPVGDVHPFSTAADVGAYFGLSSLEYSLALVYFSGFENSNVKPSRVYFYQYVAADVAAYLRGGSLAGVTLEQLKAFPAGTLTISVGGSAKTSGSINLSSATSFSNAASIIQAAFTSPGFTVSYDSTASAFVVLNSGTGATSTLTFATGTASLNTNLKLTSATGAILSQGAAATTPSAAMDAVAAVTTDWATFMTCQDPDVSGNTNKLAFAAWANAQNDRYAYVCWDADVTPSETVPATTSLGYLIGPLGNNYSGTILLAGDGLSASAAASAEYAAFICGMAASIDFTQLNGRITFAFKSQSGLKATCTNASAASNLISNGYNFYGAYATANDNFVWLYPGNISGSFLWADSYINQIWLNNQLQLAIMVLFQNTKSIPYNKQGYALIEAACLEPIKQGLNFGAFRAGVTLSAAQIAEVNSAAGVKIDTTLNEQGWYLQVLDALPQVRAARQSPPVNFWYMDGQSVQRLNIASIDVQ